MPKFISVGISSQTNSGSALKQLKGEEYQNSAYQFSSTNKHLYNQQKESKSPVSLSSIKKKFKKHPTLKESRSSSSKHFALMQNFSVKVEERTKHNKGTLSSLG